jgi:hypothetical protein
MHFHYILKFQLPQKPADGVVICTVVPVMSEVDKENETSDIGQRKYQKWLYLTQAPHFYGVIILCS